MARVIRNRQTGETKIVDERELPQYGITPQAQGTSPVGGTMPTGGMPTGGGQDRMQQLRELLPMAALSDPKHMSTYTGYLGLLDKIYPPEEKVELKGKPANDVNFARDILSSAQRAVSSYDPQFSGLGDVAVQKGLSAFNMGKPGFSKNRQDIAAIRTSIRNAIAGTAVSKSEGKELEDLIPKITDSDQVYKEKMEGIQGRVMDIVQNRLATAGYDKVSAQDYLKKQVMTMPEVEQGGGVGNFLKEMTVNPLKRTGENVLDAGVTSTQSNLAALLGLVNPEAGAQLASKDILGTQTRAAEKVQDPTKLGVQQVLDSLAIYGGAQGLGALGANPGKIGSMAGVAQRAPLQAAKNTAGKAAGGVKNLFKSSVEKVGEKEMASVGGRAGQTISRKSLLSLYDDAAEQANVSTTMKKKLLGSERAGLLDYFPDEQISVKEAIPKLRGLFKSTKNATTLVKARNEAMRKSLEQLLGPETQSFTGEYAKAYGRQKLKSKVGNQVLGAAINVPTYYLLYKLLSPLMGEDGSGNPNN